MEKTTQRLTTSIEYLCNLKMKILALKNIRLPNNQKKHYIDNIPTGWKIQYMSIPELKTEIKAGCEGFLIKTGKVSNILVVDYDNKDCSNKDLLEMLKACDTLTIKTPNKGYHFIFKYDSDNLTKCKVGLFNNIDIRSDGGMLFFGNRSDGEYIIEDMNKSIVRCPCNIRKLLMNYVRVPKPEELLKKQNIEIATNDIVKTNTIRDKYKFILSYDDIYALLSYLPENYTELYVSWFVITTILKDESELYDDSDIDKQKYYNAWNKWSANNTEKYDKTKNDIIWRNLKTTDTYIDMRYIYNIIITLPINIDKSLLPTLNRLYQDFEPLTKSLYDNIININDKYLTTSLITTDNDYIFKSGLGTGKTTSAFTYVKEQNLPIISICSLKTVIDSQSASYFAITGKELIRYDDPELLSKYAVSIANNEPISIISTIDSFHKISNLTKNNIEKYVFFVDEAHSVLEYLLASKTLDTSRDKNFTCFGSSLKKCYKILCADGDICDNIMSYIKKLNREQDAILVVNEYKSFDKVKVFILTKEQDMEDKIFKILEDNNKEPDASKRIGATICCNTKKDVEELKQRCITKGYNMENILCYTSKDGATIKDINNEWKNKVVAYSPTIVQGLDYTPKIPQPVFVYFKGSFTINPLQVGQQICRNRNISKVYIYTSGMANAEPFKDIEATRDNILETVNTIKAINPYLFDTTIKLDKKIYDENEYSSLYYEYKYQESIITSCSAYNLCKILALKGFLIIKPEIAVCSISIPRTDIQKKVMKIAIKEANNILYQQYIDFKLSKSEEKYKSSIDNIMKYYNIKPIDKAPIDINKRYEKSKETQAIIDKEQKHRLFIIDNEDNLSNPKSIQYYYAYSLLLGSTQRLDNSISRRLKEDYIETIGKSISVKVKQYLIFIKKYLKDVINPHNFSYKTDDKRLGKKISMTDDDFAYIKIFSQTKKDKPKTKLELLKVFEIIVLDIFGFDAIIKSRSKSKTDKVKVDKTIILSKEQKAAAKLAKADAKLDKPVAKRENITSVVWNTEYMQKFIVLINYSNSIMQDDYIPIVLNDIITIAEPIIEEILTIEQQQYQNKVHEFLGGEFLDLIIP